MARHGFLSGGIPGRFAAAGALLCAMLTIAAPSARAADPEFLTIGGGPSSGVFNVVATGLGDLLRKEFPKSLVDVQPGGSGPNLLRVSNGQATLGITSGNNAWDAWNGRDPAKPDMPIRNVRGLMTFFPSAIQIWVDANSKIRRIEDLKGKQISAGQPGQTSWNAFVNLLQVYGMTVADIESNGGKLHKLSWAESQKGLRDGQLDAVMWVSLYPHSTVLENETARPMRALSLDPAKIDAYLAKHGGGFEKVEIAAGLYGGQKEAALSVGTKTFLFASDKMPDEVAYRIVKTIWDKLPQFKRTHALLNFMSPDTVGKGMVVPLHPGAKKFFQEKGIAFSESTLK